MPLPSALALPIPMQATTPTSIFRYVSENSPSNELQDSFITIFRDLVLVPQGGFGKVRLR